MTIIPAPVNPGTTVRTVLKTTSVLVLGDVALNKYLDCLLMLDAWMEAHGTPEGFGYGAVLPQPAQPWWKIVSPPFKARAKFNCRVFTNTTRMDTFTYLTNCEPFNPIIVPVGPKFLTDYRVLGVIDVWMPGGNYPGWFLVWKGTAGDQWVLADETDQII